MITVYEGQRFGKLLVTSTTEGCVQKVPVRCDCGTEKAVRSDHLRKGRVVGCGKCRVLVHGYTGTRTYGAWRRMRRRCKPGGPESRWYSDRNIAVCERWDKSFNARAISERTADGRIDLLRPETDAHASILRGLKAWGGANRERSGALTSLLTELWCISDFSPTNVMPRLRIM